MELERATAGGGATEGRIQKTVVPKLIPPFRLRGVWACEDRMIE